MARKKAEGEDWDGEAAPGADGEGGDGHATVMFTVRIQRRVRDALALYMRDQAEAGRARAAVVTDAVHRAIVEMLGGEGYWPPPADPTVEEAAARLLQDRGVLPKGAPTDRPSLVALLRRKGYLPGG